MAIDSLTMNRRLWFLLLLSIVVFSANLWGPSIYVLDEAKNAGCAVEMLHRGDWVVPTFNGDLRTDKPPLHYFFMRIAYATFGVSAFSARFFSAIAGVAMILAVFMFVRIILNDRAAFISGLILITSIQLSIQFHLAVPDAYLVCFLTAGWLSFYYGWEKNNVLFLYLFYACVALATLAKGPVAPLFSGLIVVIFLLLQRELTIRRLMNLKMVQGSFIFMLIVLPWYLLVGIQTDGEWWRGFFLEHNVSRFTTTMEGHGGFPLASFAIVIAGLMPFSFFVPQVARSLWIDRRSEPFIRFCFVCAMVVMIFFAFSRTILPNYPEPAFPFVAILLAAYFSRSTQEAIARNKFWINALVYFVVSSAMPFVVSFALSQDKSLSSLDHLSHYFFVLTVGALTGLFFLIKGKPDRTLLSYVVSLIVFMTLFFYYVFPQVDNKNPVTGSSRVLIEGSKPVYYYRDFNPAFAFALQKTIPKLATPEDVRLLLRSEEGFLLVTQSRYLPELDDFQMTKVFEGKDLFETTVSVILEK